MTMTMTEIAKLAGVSQSTVSRVLNEPELVNPEKLDAVLKVLETHDFTPKKIASDNKNINIGVILLEKSLSNPGIIMKKYQSIVEHMPSNSAAILIKPDITPDKLRLFIRKQNLRGFLIIGTAKNQKGLLPILNSLPNLWLNSHRSEDNWWVLSGNEAAGRIAADYLLGKGCKKVGVLSIASENPVFAARIDSFRFKIFAVGKECSVYSTKEKFQNVEEAPTGELDRFIASSISQAELKECDGLFIPNDRITAHFYRFMQKNSIPPSEWPRIVSCNNESQYLASLYPRPATIDLTPELTAQVGLEQLFREIHGATRNKKIDVFVCPELIRGEEV